MRNPMVTTVVAVALALAGLAGCAAEAEPTESSSEEVAKPQEPSQPESESSKAVPKVDDGTVSVDSQKLPPAQRCYNNCRRGGLRDDFCSSACGW